MKKIFGSILFILPFIYTTAQIGLTKEIPSPNASSLGLYGEVPVSYFTGVPAISIPLYEVKGNKVGLPIELTYHASGLRPDMHPGWVGNGWSLQVGGVITRKANGRIDEYKNASYGTQGFYFNYSVLNNYSTWFSTPTLSTNGVAYDQVLPPANPLGVPTNLTQFADVDTEPDEFDFSFLGYSGKFFLDQTGNWQVQSDKALKVIFNPNDFVTPFIQTTQADQNTLINSFRISKAFGKFTIIDEYGNQYIFGSTDLFNTAIEFSDIMIPQLDLVGSSITATSWFLSKIISADKTETIDFNYVRGPFTSFIGYEYSAQQFNIPNDSHCQLQTANSGRAGYSGRVISPVYLKSIAMPSQSLIIDFSNVSASNELKYSYNGATVYAYEKVYNDAGINTNPPAPDYHFPSFYTLITNPAIIPFFDNNPPSSQTWERFIWLKLDAIKIINTANNINIRTIDFGYTNNSQKRLQLKSLNILDADNHSIETSGKNYYSFTYNQTSLPNYLTIYGDHWGFNNYNGNNNLGAGISLDNDFFTPRIPDASGIQTQAEILTRITYPTGGYTVFSYEPNTYSMLVDRTVTSPQPITQTGVAGGLRIKTITTTDLYGSSQTKNYYYVNGYTLGADPSTLPSSGVLDSKPQYSFNTTGITTDGRIFNNSFVSSNSIIPASSNSMGTYIGYSSVVEQRSDGSYTIYQFTNHDNGYGDQAPKNSFNSGVLNGLKFYNSFYFERGHLLKKIIYNNMGQKVNEEEIQYSLITPDSVINSVFSDNITICLWFDVGAYSRTAYLLNFSSFLPINKTSTLYDSDGSGASIIRSTQITYDKHKNVVRQQTINSKGQSEITSYSYPDLFSTTDPSNPYTMMVTMNNVSSPIEKRIIINGNLISGELYTYKSIGTSKIYNDGIYNFESNTPVDASTIVNTAYLNGGSGKLTFDGRYTKVKDISYDPSGNISSVSKTGYDPSSYIWDYNQSLPVAKVLNARNVYASGFPNTSRLNTTAIHLNLELNTNIINHITVGTSGTVNLAFTYSNPTVSGSSQLNWSLNGPSYQSGVLCAATPTSTTNCGSQTNTATITNVPPGNYILSTTLTSCLGFQNYYGYTLNITYPVNIYATVSSINDIAYTSFEYNTENDLNYGTGNWAGIMLSNIREGDFITGSKYYLLTGSTLNKADLIAAQTYIVSYWSDNGSYSVPGSQSITTGVSGSTGSWKYYEHTVTGVSTITITGAGNIDELRIYPIGALMTTYTYTPLVGITSQCSSNNYITYYQYDSFGRLILIRDRDKNILKEFKYSY